MAAADIVPFDAKTASRQEWSRFHAYRRLRHKEEYPDDPLLGDSTAEAQMKRPDPQMEEVRFAAVRKGADKDVLGWLLYRAYREGSPSFDENRHIAYIYPHVLVNHRRRGIGRQLLERVVPPAREQGKSLITIDTSQADGFAFLRAIGAGIVQRWQENRLSLDQVDWGMVRRWADEGPGQSPQSTLHWATNALDDSIIDAYCQLYTEVESQEPRDEMEVGDRITTPESLREGLAAEVDRGGTWLTAFTVEGDGTFSGLTEVSYHPDQENLLGQGETGVRESCRGRGLGKWLKAAMLLRVREDFPRVRVVVAGNATSNAAMLSINGRLGFRPYKEGGSAQIAREGLEAYLGERPAGTRRR